MCPSLEGELNCKGTNFIPQAPLFSKGPPHVDEGGVKRIRGFGVGGTKL